MPGYICVVQTSTLTMSDNDPSDAPDAPNAPRVPDRRAAEARPRYQKDNDTPLALAQRVLSSRWRAIRDKIGRDFMRRTLRIGVSARIFHLRSSNVKGFLMLRAM